jgi:hypothetical protein
MRKESPMLTVNLTETCSCGASLAVSAEETTVDRLLLEWRERHTRVCARMASTTPLLAA